MRKFFSPRLGWWLSPPFFPPRFLVAQTVKNLPAIQETWVSPLGWEDHLEKNPFQGRSPGEYPLQYSCLDNLMDRGAWQATVHGVAELDMTKGLILSLFSSHSFFFFSF